MRRAAGYSAARVTAVLGPALVCAVLLAGCGGHGAAVQQPANGVLAPTGPGPTPAASTDTSVAPLNGAAAVSGAASAPAGAGVDSDLNAVDGQLSGLDSALAQATQSPSDGG